MTTLRAAIAHTGDHQLTFTLKPVLWDKNALLQKQGVVRERRAVSILATVLNANLPQLPDRTRAFGYGAGHYRIGRRIDRASAPNGRVGCCRARYGPTEIEVRSRLRVYVPAVRQSHRRRNAQL